MNVVAEHTVVEHPDGIRLDRYAQQTFAVFASRKAARKACKRGEILVDGVPAESSRFVRAGMRITVIEPAEKPPRAWRTAIEVAYVDEHLAVVVKPAGVPVRGPRLRTLEAALIRPLPPPDRPDALRWARAVHRLDIRTSGLIVVARTGPAQVGLGQAFEARRVDKRYRALVLDPLEGEGTVDLPVDGRSAVSDWRAVDTGRVSTVDLWPRTGRTHQLRRHMAHLGHPVLGDDLYTRDRPVLRGRGLFLCSVAVAFDHPVTSQRVSVEIPEPEKFRRRRQRQGSSATP